LDKAFEWYSKAAEQGLVESQRSVAIFIKNGNRALRFNQAARQADGVNQRQKHATESLSKFYFV